MLTSPEIRAELAIKGWKLNPLTLTSDYEDWRYGGVDDWDTTDIELHRSGRHAFYGDSHRIFQFAAIAGITPQGYAIVPVKNEHAKAMVADIASLFEGYDVDAMTRKLKEFMEEPDDEEEV